MILVAYLTLWAAVAGLTWKKCFSGPAARADRWLKRLGIPFVVGLFWWLVIPSISALLVFEWIDNKNSR